MMLRDMEYIYTVYLERSFSKAARRLFISQPSLSATVRRVEQEVGLPLFNRSTNPVSLTEAGEYYIKSAEKIMAIENDMREHFAGLSQSGALHLNIGGSMFFCSYVLPDLVESFRECCPRIMVTLSEGSSALLSERLKDGGIDFLLEAEPLDKNTFESIVWTEENIIIAVPSSYEINKKLAEYRYTFEALAAECRLEPTKPPVSPASFSDEAFLILKKGNDLYRRSFAICKEAGFTPKVSMYLEQIMTAYYLVCEGKGIAFVRDTILDCLPPSDKVFFYRLTGPEASRDIYLSYKKAGAASQVQRDFIDFMKTKRLFQRR
ncbi:MAG: LysR family transcriptional regulator [Synergistaceae bacterium]|nr:LysR family transcriptional regulator [Synergistaceae bacterium]